jgi:hypothetical protein
VSERDPYIILPLDQSLIEVYICVPSIGILGIVAFFRQIRNANSQMYYALVYVLVYECTQVY